MGKALVRTIGMMYGSNRFVTNCPLTINSAVTWTVSFKSHEEED
jgi:hypothetical protein